MENLRCEAELEENFMKTSRASEARVFIPFCVSKYRSCLVNVVSHISTNLSQVKNYFEVLSDV